MHLVATLTKPILTHLFRTLMVVTVAVAGWLWMQQGACRSTCSATSGPAEDAFALPADHGALPSMNAREVLDLQLGALGGNSALGNDTGIRMTFLLASEDNRAMTGPFESFVEMVKSPMYAPLLDHRSADVEDLGGCHARQYYEVHVVGPDGEEASYLWALSRQADGAYATDSVRRR